MAKTKQLKPGEQLELDGVVPDSGVIDRIAAHQLIAVPHWVETRESCLVGVYSTRMKKADGEATIEQYQTTNDVSLAGPVPPAVPWQEYAPFDEVAELLVADSEDVKSVPVERSVLTGFIGLHARKAASIETFARRFGMLHTYTEGFVSKNGLMGTSTWRKHYLTLPEHIRKEDKDNAIDVFEPIIYWQAFSKFAFLTLRLATALDKAETGSESPISAQDWQFFERFLKPIRKPSRFPRSQPNVILEASNTPFLSLDSLTNLRAKFCSVLNELQDLGDVKLELRWEKSPPALEFRVTGLVSVIAAQLLMAASQRENFVLCKECHNAFRPWDQPLTGNVDLYCEACREDGAPERNAMRRYRATAKYRDTYQRTRLKKAQNLSGVPVRTSPAVTVSA